VNDFLNSDWGWLPIVGGTIVLGAIVLGVDWIARQLQIRRFRQLRREEGVRKALDLDA